MQLIQISSLRHLFQIVQDQNKSYKFDLDLAKKKRLLEGLDDIGMTLEKTANIGVYENKIKKSKPWI